MKTGKWEILAVVLAAATALGSVAIVSRSGHRRAEIARPDATAPARVPFPELESR